MKALIINLDKAIFSPGSASLERLKDYAGFCEKLSVVVLTRKSFEPIKIGNLSVYATGSCCRVKYLSDALDLAGKIIKQDGADLVMTQDPFDTGVIGWRIKNKFNIPWQCQVHTDFLSSYFHKESLANKIRVWAAGFLLPKADGIRVVSRRIKDSIISKYRNIEASRVIVLPIFVDAERYINTPINIDLKKKYPQFDRLILTAGRLSREKNIGLAIEAMGEIIKKYPRAGLVIVGSGPEEADLRSKIEKLKLRDNVAMEPWTDDLASYLKSADIFLLTSNYEGWGMVVAEAAASGCPLIMTDVGCAGELIVNGESGLVVPVGDRAALAVAIDRLLADDPLREKLKSGALTAAKKMPDKEEYLAEYKKSWEMLL